MVVVRLVGGWGVSIAYGKSVSFCIEIWRFTNNFYQNDEGYPHPLSPMGGG
jgi:hypothetical protein